MAGMRAGPYELLKRLSSGGMGEVFVARLANGGQGDRLVAVKLMLAYLTQETESVNRFLDEVRLAARMEHPNVVKIFDVGMSDSRPWLAMELVEGVSLYALLERCRQRGEVLPLPVVRRIAQGLLEALSYAHGLDGLQVIHRDVSPANVLLSVEGAVRLTDFGLARAKSNYTKTNPGGIDAGKLGYLAPEVAKADVEVNQRADVFSAGVTLFETYTLQHPFRRPGTSDAQTLEAIWRGDALEPRAVRPELSKQVDAALSRAMRPKASERQETALELEAALLDGPVASAEELGATVRRLCPEELAKFFALDEVPAQPLEAPTVVFSVGMNTGVIPSPNTQVTQIAGGTQTQVTQIATSQLTLNRRRWLFPAVAGAAVFALIVGGAIAVRSFRHRAKPIAPMQIPLATVAPAAAEETIDAGAAAEATPELEDNDELELEPAEPTPPPPRHHIGWLNVDGETSVMVMLDGKPLQSTPIAHLEVPVGRHVLSFKTRRGEVRRKISIVENKSFSVKLR